MATRTQPTAAPLALSAHGIVKEHGGRRVLDGAAIELPARARVGLIGRNGAGKSTLIRILCGLEPADAGTVALRKGASTQLLPQLVEGDGRTGRAIIHAARPELPAAERELHRVEAQLGDPAVIDDLDRMTRVLAQQEQVLQRIERLQRSEGDAIRHVRALGLDEQALDTPTDELSGGQRKLVALAACLAASPDVLVLDEPEAHLDVRRRSLLEELIGGFPGAVLIVCHDRYLLDETVDQIAELEGGRIRMWPGNYSAYTTARELELARQAQVYSAQQQEIARLEAAVNRYRQWAHQVLSRRHKISADNIQRRIDRMDKVERPVFERRKMALELRSASRGGERVVALRQADIGWAPDEPVLLDVEIEVGRGERIGVIGPNGSGKTLLVRVLSADGGAMLLGGERWAGPSIEIGYLSQTAAELDPRLSPIELLQKTVRLTDEQAVAQLMRFLFDYEQSRRPIATLSGGERTRLGFLALMLGQANLLVLDEPTNHLDVDAIEVLEGALERYDGTVIAVSHDRYFLDRIADRLLDVDGGGVSSFDGGFSRWLEGGAPPAPS